MDKPKKKIIFVKSPSRNVQRCVKCGNPWEGGAFCKNCGSSLNDQTMFRPHRSLNAEPQLSTDYNGRCGNCHTRLGEEDQYCRFCGTKRGEGEFRPYNNTPRCIYGPPVSGEHECKKCGKKWTYSGLGDDPTKYCPNCGGSDLNSKFGRHF